MTQATKQTIDGVDVSIEYTSALDAPVTDAEIRAYIDRGNAQHPNSSVTSLDLEVDGQDVGIRYGLAPVPFDRIRRITGYLVGTMDRWNDAKSSEEHDRVKHGVARDERSFACANGC
ncbi:anaerobic ribonucleoside-triphosphate reductase [Paraeggerthella hominis]|uniref:anaerobic ribonucleoside-triphosphate reductase n=1 Tax=Paraeggerthella hominis TaxID=2897351 RepID=UPI003D0C2698